MALPWDSLSVLFGAPEEFLPPESMPLAAASSKAPLAPLWLPPLWLPAPPGSLVQVPSGSIPRPDVPAPAQHGWLRPLAGRSIAAGPRRAPSGAVLRARARGRGRTEAAAGAARTELRNRCSPAGEWLIGSGASPATKVGGKEENAGGDVLAGVPPHLPPPRPHPGCSHCPCPTLYCLLSSWAALPLFSGSNEASISSCAPVLHGIWARGHPEQKDHASHSRTKAWVMGRRAVFIPTQLLHSPLPAPSTFPTPESCHHARHWIHTPQPEAVHCLEPAVPALPTITQLHALHLVLSHLRCRTSHVSGIQYFTALPCSPCYVLSPAPFSHPRTPSGSEHQCYPLLSAPWWCQEHPSYAATQAHHLSTLLSPHILLPFTVSLQMEQSHAKSPVLHTHTPLNTALKTYAYLWQGCAATNCFYTLTHTVLFHTCNPILDKCNQNQSLLVLSCPVRHWFLMHLVHATSSKHIDTSSTP